MSLLYLSQIDALQREALVQDSLDRGRAFEEIGVNSSNALQAVTLLAATPELKLDAVIGGGRQDEEMARAQERICSHRDSAGWWSPQDQRPEHTHEPPFFDSHRKNRQTCSVILMDEAADTTVAPGMILCP